MEKEMDISTLSCVIYGILVLGSKASWGSRVSGALGSP